MAEKEEEIKEAMDTLEEISDDEQKIRIAELRHKYILDRNSEMETAREKGLKEGREEGLQQGLQQGVRQGREEEIRKIVKSMLSENMEISIIQKITKLTREEIEKIKENII